LLFLYKHFTNDNVLSSFPNPGQFYIARRRDRAKRHQVTNYQHNQSSLATKPVEYTTEYWCTVCQTHSRRSVFL